MHRGMTAGYGVMGGWRPDNAWREHSAREMASW
jgi:hypothetical protein